MITAARYLVFIAVIPAVLSLDTIRYMPFGDSITDYGCWRPWLGEKLKSDDYKIDFVGSRRAEATCGNLDYDRDHEGHPGFKALDIAKDRSLVGWLKDNPADIISMHLGTVDIVRSQTAPPDILDAYSTLVGHMRNSNPRVKILVSVLTAPRTFSYAILIL